MVVRSIALRQDIVLDAEARQRAIQQAQQAQVRDPSAAMLLKAYAEAPAEATVRFRPRRILARMAKYYGWTPTYMLKSLDYVDFFGYVQEANAMLQEEKQVQSGNNVVADPLAAQLMLYKQFGGLKHYQGDVVRVEDGRRIGTPHISG